MDFQKKRQSPQRLSGADGAQFHIHQAEQIRICDRFLLGNCVEGAGCPLHHTRYPYHWQLRRSDNKAWQNLSDSAQRHLENLYCNVTKSHAHFLDNNNSSGKLALTSLEVITSETYDKVRRLSNTCDSQQNPYFPTQWSVFWENGNKWIKYEEPIFSDLLSAFEEDKEFYNFEFRGKHYGVDLKKFVQCNVEQGYIRHIQRRPSCRSFLTMVPYLQTISSKGMTASYPTDDILGEDPMDGYHGPYPAAWIPKPTIDQAFLQMEVVPSEAAYRSICVLFHQSLPEDEILVLTIYRIRNDDLWQRYANRKKFMSWGRTKLEKQHLEKHLFFGTSARNVESICKTNFSQLLPKQHSHIFGQGIYFSLRADYSHRYSHPEKGGMRCMFLAKVLVGKTVAGRAHYRRPPEQEPGGQLYDSCVNSVTKPQVYVVFDNFQCYPYFLIHYKLLSDPVVLYSS
nr:TCDD-inducible poly [ADP-ribose] polymerase-like [Pelodiscus sinensis]XP_025045388.1 TCDD-inducible poly [ADP-ribose] polymerase-like [Pelodiscus sinensis]|eukprot:XP_025045387.1 TCDD-inducible poly [ADP-ribose] polymerase-like [Pelodiscus sinensis]